MVAILNNMVIYMSLKTVKDADIKRLVKKVLKIKKRYLDALMFHMNFGKEKQLQEKTC